MIPHRPIEHITKYISGFLCDLCTYVVITKNKKRKVKTPHRHIGHIAKLNPCRHSTVNIEEITSPVPVTILKK